MSTINKHFRYNLKLNFNFSIGIFLFILFFRPFDASYSNVNNLILFFSGFGAIMFIFSNLFYIGIPMIFPNRIHMDEWESGPVFLLNTLNLVFNSVAFTFYLRYVGKSTISFYVVVKIVIICLAIIIIYRLLHILRFQRYLLKLFNARSVNPSEIMANKKETKEFQLISDNKSEKINLPVASLYTIKAADNYVEIYYLINEKINKKLLRNTLKNIELQLSEHVSFVRCHRTYMVNLVHVIKLNKNYKGYFLQLDNSEEIPVSRHYLLKVKEQLEEKS